MVSSRIRSSQLHRRCPFLRVAILLFLIFASAIFILKFVSKDDVRRQCMPRKNIVFIKAHKCASSTIQNIFMRFGEKNNLTFVLPEKNNYIGYPGLFERKMVPAASEFNLTYNIVTHHTRFHYQEMRLQMPEDTVYVTIVRNPVDLFESMVYYYNLKKYLSAFLEDPSFSSLSPSERTILQSWRLNGRIGINQMSFDLGLDSSDFYRPDVIPHFLSFLEQTMDLVMVAEEMDQSLVLLADLLCWKLDDVIALRLNARYANYKPRDAWPLQTRRIVSSLNAADEAVYEYFTQRFRERVQNFGEERMQRQTKELKRLAEEKMVACHVKSHEGNPNVTSLFGVIYYSVGQDSGLDCKRLVEDELVYTDILRKNQEFMFPPKLPPKLQKQNFTDPRRERSSQRSNGA